METAYHVGLSQLIIWKWGRGANPLLAYYCPWIDMSAYCISCQRVFKEDLVTTVLLQNHRYEVWLTLVLYWFI